MMNYYLLAAKREIDDEKYYSICQLFMEYNNPHVQAIGKILASLSKNEGMHILVVIDLILTENLEKWLSDMD